MLQDQLPARCLGKPVAVHRKRLISTTHVDYGGAFHTAPSRSCLSSEKEDRKKPRGWSLNFNPTLLLIWRAANA